MTKKTETLTKDENLRLSEEASNMEYEIKKNESITEILQLLESEQTFEEIISKILKITGEFLEISNAILCQWNPDGKK